MTISPSLERSAPSAIEPKVNLSACTGLADEDRDLIQQIALHLPILADFTHADVVLLARAGADAAVVAQAQPNPVPSLYAQPISARSFSREEAPHVFRVLFDGHGRGVANGTVIRGAPVLQEIIPIRNARGEIVAALRSEMAMIEHERQRKRNTTFRRAISRLQAQILSGRMRGGDQLGRLGVHDGIMVIGPSGRIEYLSATAEYLYRRLGYADNLIKTQLQELETNEYICFKAMERSVCLEQRVQEQDLLWIKRVFPLTGGDSEGLSGFLPSRLAGAVGALVAIEDVTDEMQKEQEIRIKTAMIQEIHHRVKNNLQTIAALLRMQARRATDPAVSEALRESVGRIISVAVVHEFLSHDEDASINIHEVSNRILGEIRSGVLDSSRSISLSLEGARTFTLPAQQATSCALIINELVQNSVEHAFEGRTEGKIVVRLSERPDSLAIEIADDGVGLPSGLDPMREGGLGLQIVRTLAREDLKGDLQIFGDQGTRAVVSFPRWIAKGS